MTKGREVCVGDEQGSRTSVILWCWLMGLLAIRLAAVYLPFPQWVTVTIIFAIAGAKAVLVGYYFMHLRFEKQLIYWIVGTPIVLFIIMTITLIPDIVFNR